MGDAILNSDYFSSGYLASFYQVDPGSPSQLVDPWILLVLHPLWRVFVCYLVGPFVH